MSSPWMVTLALLYPNFWDKSQKCMEAPSLAAPSAAQAAPRASEFLLGISQRKTSAAQESPTSSSAPPSHPSDVPKHLQLLSTTELQPILPQGCISQLFQPQIFPINISLLNPDIPQPHLQPQDPGMSRDKRDADPGIKILGKASLDSSVEAGWGVPALSSFSN